MKEPSAFTARMPFAAAVPPFNSDHVSCAFASSTSLSLLPSTSVIAVSSSVVNTSFTATGGSFTGVTVMVTSAVSQAPPGSQAW